jgi:hypothetical protein
MDETRESAETDIDALIEATAAELAAAVRARLGDGITADSFAGELLFEAARARVHAEACLRAAQEAQRLNGDLLISARNLKTQLEAARGKITKEVRALAEDLRVYKDSVETAESVLLPLARRGARFAGNKRGLNRLSREAIAVLEREGSDYPAKRVRRDLERAGVIREKATGLHWEDDKGNQKTTTVKQFENNISRLRKKFR